MRPHASDRSAGAGERLSRARASNGKPAVATSAVGHYVVGREKVREFALAIGETNALYLDPEYARAAGFSDVVAPPMFVAVYAGPVFRESLWSPALAVDRSMTLHGAQEFRWGPVVVAGEEIVTVAALRSERRAHDRRTLVIQTTSTNARGSVVALGRWTVLVRDRAERAPASATGS